MILSRSESLGEVAKHAWIQAVSDFYHPPLPEPVIEHEEGASSFFFINSNDWTVHLNTAGVPLNLDGHDAESYLRSICHHEIQHYLVCPFDGVTSGMLFAASRKHLPDSLAMFVCNLFADLVVDSKLLKRYPMLTHSRIQTSIHDSSLRTRDHSLLWQLVVATYRVMWGFPVPLGVKIQENTINAAQNIIGVARTHLDNERRWKKCVEEIAKIVRDWIEEEDEESLGGMEVSSSGDEDGNGNSQITLKVPADLDGIMGSPVEDRNGDRARKCLNRDSVEDQDEILERLAIDVETRNGTLEDLEAVYILQGGGTETKAWTRFWYRAKAKGLLRFQVRRQRLVGATPLAIEDWRLGDPIEELDVVQSLQAFPILVPNMSTRRWIKTMYYGESHQDELPDLLIVLDSSGSMTYQMGSKDISGAYHVALVSSFAAMDTALRKGAQVAAINFSGNILSCDWTRERKEIEDVLMAYQGGGTVMPVKQIRSLCESADSNVMAVIITDAGVSNWGPFEKTVGHLSKKGHKVFIFHIGARKGKITKAGRVLAKAGGVVIPITSISELPGLVVSEVQKTYLHDT